MGGTHYFVLRQGGGWIFVTSLHFTTKTARACLHYRNLQQDIAHQLSLIQFSVCISQACVTSHKWISALCSNIPGKGLEVPCDEVYWYIKSFSV